MGIMSCDCEKPEPKHELGVFCVKCNGFIEENNKARTEKLIDDQAKIHPWFEKKPPVKVQTEEKSTSGTEVLESKFKGLQGDLIVHRIMSDRDIEILEEHRDLMEDIITGNYKPDSFTNQPIQILIDRLLNK